MTTAKDFLARIEAGLLLCGFEDHEYQWFGTTEQWANYEIILNA